MTEENDLAEQNNDEEIVEEVIDEIIENAENIEFEDEDSKPQLPIDYSKKLGPEEEEEEEEPFFVKNINALIKYLDGKSRNVVIGTLVVFLISIINFIAWNITNYTYLEYFGTVLSFVLLLGCAMGILISYNVYNIEINQNKDVRISGFILSAGSVLLTSFVMFYELSQNPCLIEFREENCDPVNVDSLRAITTVAVFAGRLGIVMLI